MTFASVTVGSSSAADRNSPAWLRARALRADMQPAAFVEPSDAAAAGANLDDVENRDADRKPFVIAADEIVGRETRLAAPNHASAFAVVPPISKAIAASRSSSSQSAMVPDHAARPVPIPSSECTGARHFDVGQAAVGLHDHQAAREPIAVTRRSRSPQIMAYLRSDVGARRHGRSAFVFAVLARQLVATR